MKIRGIGTALPKHSVKQRDAAEIAAQVCCASGSQGQWLSRMYEMSGVRTRHSVLLNSDDGPVASRQSLLSLDHPVDSLGPSLSERMRYYEAEAGPLAARAAAGALDEAGISGNRITHLITVSCTGFSAPGFDFDLIRSLGLPPSVARTHVGFMGCHGALNGLRVARAFAQSDPTACVLLCAVELCSLHHYCGWDTEKIVANSLFGDGAAAVVGTGRALDPSNGNDGGPDAWRVAAHGSFILPGSERAMTWRIADHGFEMTLFRNVPGLIRQHLGPWLQLWLQSNGLSIGDIGSWAIHPGGPRIVTACAESAGLDVEQLADSRAVLERFGNMSSPTILFILDRLRRRNAARPCVTLGFGPGMVVEAALLSD